MGIPLAAPGFNVVVRGRLSSRAPPRDQMGSLGSTCRMPGETLMRERSEHGGSLGWLVVEGFFCLFVFFLFFFLGKGNEVSEVQLCLFSFMKVKENDQRMWLILYVYVCVHVHTCGGQRLILGVHLGFWEGIPPWPGAPILSRLAGRWASRVFLTLRSCWWDYQRAPLCLP